jgi:triosephosphate isomerase
MSRKPYIVGNWKMNQTAAEARETIAALKEKVADIDAVDIGICPTYTSLAAAVEAAAGSNIAIGAQNVHWEESGAFTSQISAAMLKELGIDYSIVGHSECRALFGDTDETVNKRVKTAITAGMSVIMCCGEVLEQRKSGETNNVVARQVKAGLDGLDAEAMAAVTVAYEPVWAIGTGETATPEQAQEVHALIRQLLKDMFDDSVAAATRIQYGGSVKPGNVADLMSREDIDGALVGGASLKPDVFAELIRNAC